ncbi:PRC-barrel domain-containing protein [Rhodocytophaga aerolata]|uniref:PRC-barrel domain-containing protein n=1 Tax=Rhodocytophaga aerolata TaxID=455078 RepID=A0ABT8RLJ3_9BACT|nr:PRC-barrel domain-containing protein [Rhodocytophaga aerolata]MDO1452007.1 PRC-barrel domain-containing protein [Rhodocytophaga aerolata]
MNTPILAQGARLTAVTLKNQAGEEVGKVIEWLMDVQEGRVVYVVAKFNEANAYFAIPWALMKADLEAGGYLVDQDKVKEHNLQIDHNSLSEIVLDKEFLDRIFDTYQLPKYWEENQLPTGNHSSSTTIGSGPSGQEDSATSNADESEGKGYGG